MVTCSRLSLEALCGEDIRQTTTPPPHSNIPIKITMGSDRSWLIPISPDTSWPAFLSLFGETISGIESQGASAKFEYNNRIIDGKLWHDLVETAKSSSVELLVRDVQFHVTDADLEMLNEEAIMGGAEDTTLETTDDERPGEESVLAATRNEPATFESITLTAPTPFKPGQRLQLFKHVGSAIDMYGLADRLHDILLNNNRSKENVAYRRCPGAKASNISSWLASNSQQVDAEGRSTRPSLLTKPKRRIVMLAKYLFCMFWPLTFEHPMTEKFWGALHQILGREDEFYYQVFLVLINICVRLRWLI